jgi:thioredoxin 1
MLAPTIKQLSKALKGTVKVIKVDVDKAPQAAQKFKVRGVPTLVLFHQGEILWRHSGVMSFEQLKNKIEQHLPKHTPSSKPNKS